MSHKSEMAGPFIRGDTIINKHFTLLYRKISFVLAAIITDHFARVLILNF